MEYTVHVSFRLDAKTERKVRIEAAKQDMNRSEFIITAIKEKLERAVEAESEISTVS